MPLPLRALVTASLLAALASRLPGSEPVTLTRLPDRVRIDVGGRPFTSYVFAGAHRPYFYPVLAPDGTELNREYPMKDAEGEDRDHVHHRSLWFAHSCVDGIDFWNETGAGRIPKGFVVHDALLETTNGSRGVLRATDRWTAPDGRLVCTDETTVRVEGDAEGRTLDYTIVLRARPDAPLRFGDNKDGAMALRLAQWMTLPHKYQQKELPGQGHYLTAAGLRDGAAWGTRSGWCDAYAPRAGKVYGVALFSDPRNPGGAPSWMARDYGLFAANPFGLQNYDRVEEKPGPADTVVPAGGSLTLHYRFYFHLGAPEQAGVAERYAAFLKELK